MAETDGIKQRKALLTTNQQIEHLKSKGVTFKLCSEKDAANTSPTTPISSKSPHTGSSSKNASADNTMASTSTSTSGT